MAQYREIQRRIRDFAVSHGCTPPILLSASKEVEAERLKPYLAAGMRHFGENRVQEALDKWPGLMGCYPDIRLHAIGPLQSNKVRDAVALFDVIETINRDKIAGLVADEAVRQGRRPECFIQVNIGREEQKSGIDVSELEQFLLRCRDVHGLNVTGLMTVPPAEMAAAPYFALLKRCADMLGLKKISMGMSGDWESAIRFGSTEIRLGTALFGQRG